MGLPSNPRFITSRLNIHNLVGMCFDAAGDLYENTKNEKDGRMGEKECHDTAWGGGGGTCTDAQNNDVTIQFPDRQSCEAQGYSWKDVNSWIALGQRGCYENGEILPSMPPHCYYLDPNVGQAAFDTILPTGWFKADGKFDDKGFFINYDNEASCETGEALFHPGDTCIDGFGVDVTTSFSDQLSCEANPDHSWNDHEIGRCVCVEGAKMLHILL